MTPEVIDLLRRLEPQLRPFERIALLSPSKEERALLPEARVLSREDWDLDQRRRDLRFDLIIACHVFHYATDASRWIDNARASCRALMMLDLVARKRSAESEFGPDGDRTRYAIGPHEPAVPYFDLNGLGERLLAHHVFAGQPNQYGPAQHLLALIRGDLDGPLVRIDGCPVEGEQAVLERFEQPGVPVVVEVAAASASVATLARLRELPWLECALHGVEETLWSRASTLARKLRESRDALEQGVGRAVRCYVPRGERLGRRTARVLREMGFDLCLSERASELPTLRSDYRGGSMGLLPHEARVGGAPEVIRLDLKGEWEVEPPGGGDRQAGLLESVGLQRTAAAVKIEGLSAAVSGLAPNPYDLLK
jgi:hypothetical protein